MDVNRLLRAFIFMWLSFIKCPAYARACFGWDHLLIDGLERPIAIVGDAIFAGSMGGGMISYEDALRTNREKIMTLPDDTVLCPGHGPLTTVGREKKNNPFFPEFP